MKKTTESNKTTNWITKIILKISPKTTGKKLVYAFAIITAIILCGLLTIASSGDKPLAYHGELAVGKLIGYDENFILVKDPLQGDSGNLVVNGGMSVGGVMSVGGSLTAREIMVLNDVCISGRNCLGKELFGISVNETEVAVSKGGKMNAPSSGGNLYGGINFVCATAVLYESNAVPKIHDVIDGPYKDASVFSEYNRFIRHIVLEMTCKPGFVRTGGGSYANDGYYLIPNGVAAEISGNLGSSIDIVCCTFGYREDQNSNWVYPSP